MTKNRFILIILLFTFAFSLNLKGIALDSSYKNSLEEIDIKKASSGSYVVNLLFTNAYNEPLSIQKKTSGMYSIILPETQISSNDVKVVYKDGKDKIKLDIKEFPYLDQSINNGYVKITATTKDKISLKVASDINLSPQMGKVSSKNIEIVKREQKQIKQPISKPTENEINQAKQPVAKTPLEVANGSVQIKQKTNIQPKKNSINPDYLDILIKISLVLFIILVALRQFYKKIKSAKDKIIARADSREKTVSEHEETQITENQSEFDNAQQSERQKSQFEQEFENLNQKGIHEDVIMELDDNELFISEASTQCNAEDEFEDEDFDYDFDFDEEEEETEYSAPKLISTAQIDKNKGFYLVKYDGQTALIGYVKDEIFVLNKFDKIYNQNLQARLNERKKNKSNYIVRLDNYKALIEVSEKDMNVLIEF